MLSIELASARIPALDELPDFLVVDELAAVGLR
jgi:hypothetical protein